MTEYRDPFDLSPPPILTDKQLKAQRQPSKAVVRRVSIGPLLHSRIVKILVIIGIVVLAGLGSYVVTLSYLADR